jgi:hypothetical protein
MVISDFSGVSQMPSSAACAWAPEALNTVAQKMALTQPARPGNPHFMDHSPEKAALPILSAPHRP